MGVPHAEVIGDPVAHSKSPLIHKFWLEKLGLEGDYRVVRVTLDELPAYLESRRGDPDWRGCNLTMPLKRLVCDHADRVGQSAVGAGSSNCLFRDAGDLKAINTDVRGVGAALRDVELAGGSVALIGSGAAAETTLWCLKEEGVGSVRIVARNRERAASLLSRSGLGGAVYAFDEAEIACSGVVALVNASPLGMSRHEPLPRGALEAIRHTRAEATIFDMVYDPHPTALLAAAEAFGRRPVDGFTMLVEQARDSFAHFFGAPAPREHDAELRELLTS